MAQASFRDNDLTRFYRPGMLNRFLTEAPYLARCSGNKTAANVRPRELALNFPYMQANRRDMVSWLIFDLDHSDSFIWEDAQLPPPNIIVLNPNNGHSHLYYAIAPVCTSENARSEPIQYMKAVYEGMMSSLRADPAYRGPIAKTPGHPWWSTAVLHEKEYSLGDLAAFVELPQSPPWSKGPDLDSVSHSRHLLLFETLRYYAYSIVNREREYGSFKSFTRMLEAYASAQNNFKSRGFSADLSVRQVAATVKSVARWTWDRYTGTGRCNRGVMCLVDSEPLAEKQRKSALRTQEIRKTRTESNISRACNILRAKGAPLTQVSVAKLAGVTRQTVAKYKHLLQQEASPRLKLVKSAQSTLSTSDVNFGAYQITAAPELGGSIHEMNSGGVFDEGNKDPPD